jgi:hypothetical protein
MKNGGELKQFWVWGDLRGEHQTLTNSRLFLNVCQCGSFCLWHVYNPS